MNDLFSLAGKNILITGSAQGIGFLLATGLGKYGAQIIINDITAERAELAVEKLHQEGIQAVAAPFNVTHKHEIDAAVEHIEKDIGPIDAVKRSAELLKKTWGENLIGNGGIGLVFGLITLVLALAGFAAIFAAISSGNFTLLYVMAVLLGVVFLLLILIQAALQGVYSAALYRFASEGDAGQGFDKAVVADAFRVKG